MNRNLKQAILSLRKAKKAGHWLGYVAGVDAALRLLTPRAKRAPKELPKELQSTKPHRAAAHKQSTKEIRAAVMERSEGRCELGVACVTAMGANPLELHHVEGGSGRRRQAQSVSNCVLCCRACHRAYHHDPETFRFAVEEWAKAFGYPVPSRFRRGA